MKEERVPTEASRTNSDSEACASLIANKWNMFFFLLWDYLPHETGLSLPLSLEVVPRVKKCYSC